MELQNYSSLLKSVLEGISHEKVEVKGEWTELKTLVLLATCQKYEQGLLMGKNVANVKALQKIFMAIGQSRGQKIYITINGEGSPGKKAGFKQWNAEQAEKLFSDLLSETGVDIMHLRLEPFRNGTAMILSPPLSPELHEAFNVVMTAYGKSHNHHFGLIREEELV